MTVLSRLGLSVAIAVVFASGSAAAQRPWLEAPKDFDQDKEEFSRFWERALKPEKERYRALIAQARTLAFDSSKTSRAKATQLLRDAVALAKDEPEAHWELGMLHKRAERWADCDSALTRVFELDPRYAPSGQRPWGLDVELGTCRARAGNYQGAIEQLKRPLARGVNRTAIHQTHRSELHGHGTTLPCDRVFSRRTAIRELPRNNE